MPWYQVIQIVATGTFHIVSCLLLLLATYEEISFRSIVKYIRTGEQDFLFKFKVRKFKNWDELSKAVLTEGGHKTYSEFLMKNYVCPQYFKYSDKLEKEINNGGFEWKR